MNSASNPMNRVVFASPNLDISSPNFGKINGTNGSPRVIQFGMKLIW